MLTLAGFVLEKFGGDTHRRRPGEPRPLPGADRGRPTPRSPAAARRRRRHGTAAAMPHGARARGHGLTGTDEAGSGGDD